MFGEDYDLVSVSHLPVIVDQIPHIRHDQGGARRVPGQAHSLRDSFPHIIPRVLGRGLVRRDSHVYARGDDVKGIPQPSVRLRGGVMSEEEAGHEVYVIKGFWNRVGRHIFRASLARNVNVQKEKKRGGDQPQLTLTNPISF